MVPDELARSPYVRLVTFRRSGAAVPTPVWAAAEGDALYVWTRDDSGKVKRIRNNGRVTLAPCDVRGRTSPDAPVTEGRARLLDEEGTAKVRRLLARKYGWRFRLVDLSGAVVRRGKRPHVGIAITF